MNGLLRLSPSSPLVDLFGIKNLLYVTLISDVVSEEDKDDGVTYAVCRHDVDDIFEMFGHVTESELDAAFDKLEEEGLIFFDSIKVYVGEIRGRKFFTFEKKSSLYEDAINKVEEALKYGAEGSFKARFRYLKQKIRAFIAEDVNRANAVTFMDFHNYLYEVYTGGEMYTLRNKTEVYQIPNILKVYDKHTTFAILVEGVLNYDKYRKSGVPTLTNVAVLKDDIFRGLVRGDGSKDYMRKTEKSIDTESSFI